MPSVDTTEDADIVERHFSKWDALATIRRFIDRNGQVSFAVDCDDQQTKFAVWSRLCAFIAGMYAERDRAEQEKNNAG